MQVPVVAIDGPVAVGKSSVALRVAESLALRHINTGSMYRAVALLASRLPRNESHDPEHLTAIAREMQLELLEGDGVRLNGEIVTSALRDESISRFVSVAADVRAVREALVAKQRALGLEQPCVLEGRDIGTVVFHDAAVKIYLDAATSVRVERRARQLVAMGKEADAAQIQENLATRDRRDREREWGALRIAADATVLDSTNLSEDRVVELLCAIVRANPVFQDVATAHA